MKKSIILLILILISHVLAQTVKNFIYADDSWSKIIFESSINPDFCINLDGRSVKETCDNPSKKLLTNLYSNDCATFTDSFSKPFSDTCSNLTVSSSVSSCSSSNFEKPSSSNWIFKQSFFYTDLTCTKIKWSVNYFYKTTIIFNNFDCKKIEKIGNVFMQFTCFSSECNKNCYNLFNFTLNTCKEGTLWEMNSISSANEKKNFKFTILIFLILSFVII
jgi:hypothetical protein